MEDSLNCYNFLIRVLNMGGLLLVENMCMGIGGLLSGFCKLVWWIFIGLLDLW